MKRSIVFGLFLLLLHTSRADGQAEPLRVTFGDISNGYSVHVEVNGAPLPAIRGDQSEAVQLFARDDARRARAGAEMANLFCLVEGRNTVKITFQPIPGAHPGALHFYMQTPAYSVPVLEFEQQAAKSGVIDTAVEIRLVMPPNYRTVQPTVREH